MSDQNQPTEQAPPDAVTIEHRRPTRMYRWLSAVLLRLEAWVRSHGSVNIRWGTRLCWALVVALGLLLLFGPVINKPLSFDDITASTEDVTATWIARSFRADYDVQRTADGHLRVGVTEHIDVFFPDDVDDERIERVIPSQYQSHDLDPTLTGATFDGADVDVHTKTSADGIVFRIPHAGGLSGDHDVVLRYTLHDMAFAQQDDSTRQWEQLLEWNVLGPDFGHGLAHAELHITVPNDLVDAYSRQPSGGISWLLAGDSSQLEPDSHSADAVTYSLVNDQNMPPYTTFWFRFPFHSGTFTLPGPSFLYWVQVIGPFVPLLLLLATLLFSLAARAVAWSDARGRAWFVYREEPPGSVSAPVAARVWRSVLAAPLVGALDRYQSSRTAANKRALVRAAAHAGRLGNLLFAWTHYLAGDAWRTQFDEKLRRVPRGFVRDSFIGAALAWTVLQWGLVRQLSYQMPLTVYWWPVAVVAASTVLSVVILIITLSARPLTRRGALVKEELLGLQLYTQQTSADERTSLRDRLLPYTVMFSSPRRAGQLIRRLLAREGVDADVAADPDFVTGGRLAVRIAALLAVPAAIAVAIWVPASTHRIPDDAAYDSDAVAGAYGFFVSDFSSDATLVTSGDGGVQLDVTEKLTGVVQSGFRNVPQVVRQWRDTVDGHRMRLAVTSVTIDGADVDYTQERVQGQALLRTQVADEWPGDHDVVIHYTITDPIAEVFHDGQWQQRLRWTALNPGWKFGWSGVDLDVHSVSVALTVPEKVADAALPDSGWLGGGRWPDTGVRGFDDPSTTADGIRYQQTFTPDEHGVWPYIHTDDDVFAPDRDLLGVQFAFPEDTFAAGPRAPYVVATSVRALPVALPLLSALVAIGAGLVGILRRRRALSPVATDITRWITPWFTVATCVLAFWATIDMDGDEAVFFPIMGGAVLSIGASIWMFIATRKNKKTAGTSRPGAG